MNAPAQPGRLILIPSAIEENLYAAYLPAEITQHLATLGHFVVEELKTARRFIKKMVREKNIDDCTFYELNEHTSREALQALLQPLLNGHDVGLLSEAGCPGVADPGQQLVELAHRHQVTVVPLVGPSSLLLALMASGLNGQQFKFNGYLPKDRQPRRQKIKELEKETQRTGCTQLFIETPYRNDHLLEDLLSTLESETLLCIACEIKSANEFIRTQTAKAWKNDVPVIGKKKHGIPHRAKKRLNIFTLT